MVDVMIITQKSKNKWKKIAKTKHFDEFLQQNSKKKNLNRENLFITVQNFFHFDDIFSWKKMKFERNH